MTELKKSGLVTLIGRSNVGKSTLLNALVGFKVSATSPRAQTTRFATKGILNEGRGQIVFVDTPGLFLQVPNQLTRLINRQVKDSVKDINLILYVVDPTREIGQEEERLLALVRPIKNKILVINKIDLQKPKYIYDYESLDKDFLTTVKISAKNAKHLPSLIAEIFTHLSIGDPIYATKQTHDISLKQWVAEIIREKVFYYLHQEVPYSVTVEVDSLDRRPDDMLEIKARIITNQDRYRPILIGRGGAKLKEIGTAARKELELVLQKKIYLNLQVETDPHWLDKIT
jgi:GTPase